MLNAMTGGFSTSWLWIAAGLYLLFEMWRGWRRGVVRHGISVMALLTAGGIGWVFAWMTGFIADRIIPLPVPAGRFLFGAAAALAFYIAAIFLSSLLFKKTSQQSSGIVRLVYGAGGAFFGLIFGLMILWGGLSIVRALGAMAEGRQAVATVTGHGAPALAGGLTSIKGALEQGTTGRLVDKVDIVPSNTYGIITKFVELAGSQQATARFFAYPGTQKLLMHTKFMELFNDPSVAKAASEGNYLALLANPRLAEVARDPGVQKAFASFELEKALDYALQKPAPSPVQSP